MKDITVNRFRKARGLRIQAQIDRAADALGRDIVILDVGGRPDYWDNLAVRRVSKIVLMNIAAMELDRGVSRDLFETRVGNACDLSDWADGSVDFLHSNSVIEHVGGWREMRAMAVEVQRVGRHGWVQTPAWEFPVEPHWRAPFLHWFARPMQARLLGYVPRLRNTPEDSRREIVESVNLLSRSEFLALFGRTSLYVERFALFPKSYSAFW